MIRKMEHNNRTAIQWLEINIHSLYILHKYVLEPKCRIVMINQCYIDVLFYDW